MARRSMVRHAWLALEWAVGKRQEVATRLCKNVESRWDKLCARLFVEGMMCISSNSCTGNTLVSPDEGFGCTEGGYRLRRHPGGTDGCRNTGQGRKLVQACECGPCNGTCWTRWCSQRVWHARDGLYWRAATVLRATVRHWGGHGWTLAANVGAPGDRACMCTGVECVQGGTACVHMRLDDGVSSESACTCNTEGERVCEQCMCG